MPANLTAVRNMLARFGRDIAVIILGVLIALAFDNWTSSRAERKLERNYFARLSRDLRADSVMLENYLRQSTAGEAGARELLTALLDRDVSLADSLVARHFSDATRGALLSSRRPTIEELTSTGNLRVLRDDKARDAVLAYYAEVDRMQRSIETVMRRGREPLGEVGWDIRAFDLALSYAVTRYQGPARDAALSADAEGQQALLARFRAHPDAMRATRRAITYNGMLRPIITDWISELGTVRSVLAGAR
jgi:hypothetical protein